jgi:DNA polymerase III delta prime subunit
MVPAAMQNGCASRGEREVFTRLQHGQETEDWFALHSLDLASHPEKLAGEIDFLLMIPGKGILCIEVKGCSRLRRAGGLWFYGADPLGDPRGPFKQASQAMHGLRRQLLDGRPNLGGVPFYSCVLFPYVQFAERSPEWHSWQVIDRRAFGSRPLERLLSEVLDEARAHMSGSPSCGWFHPERGEPSIEQCEQVLSEFRGDFEVYESPASRRARLESELKHYTNEQFAALDAMERNPRVAFEGPAGTGKTLLAIEAARRAASAGRRTVVVCYNRLLGHWLADELEPLKPLVRAGTLHSLMLGIAHAEPPSDAGSGGFWAETLPGLAFDELIESAGASMSYEELIVDEAQDLLRPQYLDVLDLLVDGGLRSGRWRAFGDFENQAIFGLPVSLQELTEERAGSAPCYSLRVNCRNTPRISCLMPLLAHMDPDYSRVLRPDDGLEPELQFWRGAAAQEDKLVQALTRLWSEGFRGGDIVILSPHGSAECAAGRVRARPWRDRLAPADEAARGKIAFCSVSSFKGREAPAVILTDVDNVRGEHASALFYVAISRALSRLVILASESAREGIVAELAGEPAEGASGGRASD